MELHLKIIGSLLIALGFSHAIFPRYFDWRKELAHLSLINRQIMYVHTLFIALGVTLLGMFCWISSRDIIETELGREIALGLGIFWAFRLFIQFFGYSSELWRGKRFETAVHIVFSALWTYISVVFLTIYWTAGRD